MAQSFFLSLGLFCLLSCRSSHELSPQAGEQSQEGDSYGHDHLEHGHDHGGHGAHGASDLAEVLANIKPSADTEDQTLADLTGVQPAGDQEVDPLKDASYRRGVSRGGTYVVAWKPIGGPVPKNQHFELEVHVYKNNGTAKEPLAGTQLAFSGWMPAHGHGMIVRPQAIEQGAGKYRARGMLFHMGGHWQFFIDVIDNGHSERLEFDILL